jgi:hypothetical protein
MASGSVLEEPLFAAIQGAARKPFTFTIPDIANSLPTGVAAVACGIADRDHGRFIAAWPIAKRMEQKRRRCVTTRRRNLGIFNGLRCELSAVTALFLCLGVSCFDAGVLAAFRLPSGCLPAVDLP